MPFILANAWLASALMKIPEFRLPYMAILAGLASGLLGSAEEACHDASVMGRIWRSRVRTARSREPGRGRAQRRI